MELQCEDNDEYTTHQLSSIRDKIETMSQFNQIEILRIFKKHNEQQTVLNENRNGVHINLSELDPQIIKELFMYVNYVSEQENNLTEIERQQDDFKKTYFEKEIKDTA